MFAKKKKKTPLPAVRRLAGQSLREEKERLLDDRLIPFYFSAAFLWVLWAFEYLHAQWKLPLQPTVFLGLAIVATGVCAIVFGRLFYQFRRLNRGELGELKVAEVLEELRPIGYRAFHDIVRDGFNIDHVLVGPAGVFAIETKFRSGRGEITFRNGEGIFVDGRPEEKDSLKQARGNAAEIRKLIKENCSLDQYVGAVVVFVGDWRVRNEWRHTDARVFTPETLLRHIANEQPVLTGREIAMITSHLERSAKGA